MFGFERLRFLLSSVFLFFFAFAFQAKDKHYEDDKQTFTFNLFGKTYDKLSVRMKMESTTQEMADELQKLLGRNWEN